MYLSYLLDSMRAGATLGFGFSLLYSIYATGLWLTRGSEPFEGVGTSLPGVLIAYFVGGRCAGGIVGAMFPLSRVGHGERESRARG